MHNSLTRLQNVFGTFTTAASFVALAIALMSLVTTPSPQIKDGSLALRNVQVVKGRPYYYSRKPEEYAHIKFDLDVDISDLFTWNTKQVFLYITATYPTSSSASKTSSSAAPATTAILWDAILQHPLAPPHVNHYDPSNPKGRSSSSSSSRKKSKKEEPKKKKTIQDVSILKLDNQKPKYQITDPTGRLAGRANATLELNWNIQPWVGALTWGAGGVQDQIGGKSWFGHSAWWHTWRNVAGQGRTLPFAMPGTKNQTQASEEAGKEGLGVAKGKEGYRLEVGGH